MPRYTPKFKKGDLVAHTNIIGKFYIIIRDNRDGTYEARLNEDGWELTFVFMEEYLLSKEDRRDKWLEDLLN
jgi:hypothetical protein